MWRSLGEKLSQIIFNMDKTLLPFCQSFSNFKNYYSTQLKNFKLGLDRYINLILFWKDWEIFCRIPQHFWSQWPGKAILAN
jgi:hypothetical protein